MVSFSNPNGDITNSDLEMAGLLAEYLVLEHLMPLQFAHGSLVIQHTNH
jgi:hypothetical protein